MTTSLWLVAAGLVMAASVWPGGGQENSAAGVAEIGGPKAQVSREGAVA